MKIFALLMSSTLLSHAGFSIAEKNGTITILSGDKLVTEYRTDSRVPYLYPNSAPDSVNLSRHWPMENDVPDEEKDHPHHRGFWFSHGEVNGFDFWAFKSKGEPKIIHQSTEKIEAKDNSATIAVELAWVAQGTTFLTEKRSYIVKDIDAHTRIVDLKSTLTAATEDVTFGDSKEGFCGFRVDCTLRLKGPVAKGHILDSEARHDDQCWGKKSNWVAFSGPDYADKPAVISMMDHQDNLRHPTWWHARDYGLLAANPFGIHDFENKKNEPHLGNFILKKGESITFQYRLVLQSGNVDEKSLTKTYQDFNDKKK